MILLDTNVLSEPLRPAPDTRVVEWLNRAPLHDLYLSTITLAEVRYGVAVLPDGGRRTRLIERLQEELLPLFAGHILVFDEAAADAFGELQARSRAKGAPLPLADAMIAAVASSRGCALATRNVKDFAATGLSLVNPWEA